MRQAHPPFPLPRVRVEVRFQQRKPLEEAGVAQLVATNAEATLCGDGGPATSNGQARNALFLFGIIDAVFTSANVRFTWGDIF